MKTCGLWPGQRYLVAVVADDGRLTEPARKVSYTDEARCALVHYIESHHGRGCAFVATTSLARTDPIVRHAAMRGVHIWMAPDPLIDDLRVLAGKANASTAQLALLLARLPLCVLLRPQLRLMRLQLPLFAATGTAADSPSL